MPKRTSLNEETDAELAPDAESTWIGVNDFSIYIKKTADGVVVDIYAKGFEDCQELDSAHAYDSEVEEMREEEDLEVD